jgi:hypothetical protein
MASGHHTANKRATITASVICNITEAKFENNIHLIFTRGCGVDVFGFNSITGQFWGKTMVKNNCVFHFTLIVDDINDKESNIKITQHVGNNETMAKFTKQLCTVVTLFRLIE